MNEVTWNDFEKVDIRVGRVIEVSLIANAKYSTHKLKIDFGKEIGVKKSCARLVNYSLEELRGKFILGVTNFPARQVGKNMSEVLVLGVPDDNNECILWKPDKEPKLGVKFY